MKKYLIVNRGSASEKYAIYTEEKCLGFLHTEESEKKCDYVSTLYMNKPLGISRMNSLHLTQTNRSESYSGNSEDISEVSCVTKREFDNCLDYSLKVFIEKGIITNKKEIAGIGIRIVAPGEFFQADKVIDKAYEKEIKKIIEDAPLHILPTYEAILELKKKFKDVPMVGVTDSDFHKTIPARAKYYGLPFADTKKYQIERYGYHGISMESIINRLKKEGNQIPARLIICHIGSGASLTAVKDGRSIENSMGYTPLEGIMMATRAGDIDPGTVAFLSEKLKLRDNKLKEYLNTKCGLLGVSGKSSDVRDLLKLEKDGDVQAKLALDMYVYRLQKYIGSYYVALGGLDAIIFTATVGERSFIMRERICQGLEILGIKINKAKNNQSEGVDADISAADSKVKVLVRKTDEMEQIAQDTINTLGL